MKIERPRGGERPGHATHDQLLVARFAAGDTTDAETSAARELVATCPDCRLLASDLLAIARATADLPQPVRRRDFRMTPEQAARLRRPAVLAWLPRAFGGGESRRLVGLQRLAGAAVAIGLVMAVVTSPAGIPGFSTGTAQKATLQSGEVASGAAAPRTASGGGALLGAAPGPSAAPAAAAAAPAAPGAQAATSAPQLGGQAPVASGPPPPAAGAAASPPLQDRSSVAQPTPAAALAPVPTGEGGAVHQFGTATSAPTGPGVQAWQAWLLLAVAGLLAFVAIRLSLRRVS